MFYLQRASSLNTLFLLFGHVISEICTENQRDCLMCRIVLQTHSSPLLSCCTPASAPALETTPVSLETKLDSSAEDSISYVTVSLIP